MSKPSGQNAPTVDPRFASGWSVKERTPLALKWDTDEAAHRLSNETAFFHLGRTDWIRLKLKKPVPELHSSSRAIQFRLVPWKYLMESGAVFQDTFLVNPPDFDLLIPLHALHMIQNSQ